MAGRCAPFLTTEFYPPSPYWGAKQYLGESPLLRLRVAATAEQGRGLGVIPFVN